jgi:hypothetical protein
MCAFRECNIQLGLKDFKTSAAFSAQWELRQADAYVIKTLAKPAS